MINEFLRLKREKSGISREKLCEGICSESTLYRFESGNKDISLHTFFNICEKLNIKILDISRNRLTEDEYKLYLIILDAIYYQDNEHLNHILDTIDESNVSDYFKRILLWSKSVSYYNHQDIANSKNILYQINPKMTIRDSFDINILNSLSMAYILEEEWDKSFLYLKRCIENKKFFHPENMNLYVKVLYNYAYVNYKIGNINETHIILEELLCKLKMNNSYFMLGKVYYFNYICLKHLNKQDQAIKNIKKAYCTFFIEDNQDNYLSHVKNKLIEEKINMTM